MTEEKTCDSCSYFQDIWKIYISRYKIPIIMGGWINKFQGPHLAHRPYIWHPFRQIQMVTYSHSIGHIGHLSTERNFFAHLQIPGSNHDLKKKIIPKDHFQKLGSKFIIWYYIVPVTAQIFKKENQDLMLIWEGSFLLDLKRPLLIAICLF